MDKKLLACSLILLLLVTRPAYAGWQDDVDDMLNKYLPERHDPFEPEKTIEKYMPEVKDMGDIDRDVGREFDKAKKIQDDWEERGRTQREERQRRIQENRQSEIEAGDRQDRETQQQMQQQEDRRKRLDRNNYGFLPEDAFGDMSLKINNDLTRNPNPVTTTEFQLPEVRIFQPTRYGIEQQNDKIINKIKLEEPPDIYNPIIQTARDREKKVRDTVDSVPVTTIPISTVPPSQPRPGIPITPPPSKPQVIVDPFDTGLGMGWWDYIMTPNIPKVKYESNEGQLVRDKQIDEKINSIPTVQQRKEKIETATGKDFEMKDDPSKVFESKGKDSGKKVDLKEKAKDLMYNPELNTRPETVTQEEWDKMVNAKDGDKVEVALPGKYGTSEVNVYVHKDSLGVVWVKEDKPGSSWYEAKETDKIKNKGFWTWAGEKWGKTRDYGSSEWQGMDEEAAHTLNTFKDKQETWKNKVWENLPKKPLPIDMVDKGLGAIGNFGEGQSYKYVQGQYDSLRKKGLSHEQAWSNMATEDVSGQMQYAETFTDVNKDRRSDELQALVRDTYAREQITSKIEGGKK